MDSNSLYVIGFFFIVVSIPAFFLPDSWWLLSALFFVIGLVAILLRITWGIAGFGQRQIEKLDED